MRVKTWDGPVVTYGVDEDHNDSNKSLFIGDFVCLSPWNHYLTPSNKDSSLGVCLDDYHPHDGCIIIEGEN